MMAGKCATFLACVVVNIVPMLKYSCSFSLSSSLFSKEVLQKYKKAFEHPPEQANECAE